MNRRRKKLTPVRQFASRGEQSAARDLAAAAAELQAAERLLAELTDYRASYEVPESARDRWDASRWQDFGAFLYRLNAGINAQQDVIDQCRRRVDALRQEWQRRRSRRKSIDRLDAKLAREDQQRLEHLLQKEADDLALHRRGRVD